MSEWMRRRTTVRRRMLADAVPGLAVLGLTLASGCAATDEASSTGAATSAAPAVPAAVATKAAPPAPEPEAGFDIIRTHDPGTVVSAAGGYEIRYAIEPVPIPLNDPFDLVLEVTDRRTGTPVGDDVALLADGRMPHHRHGMLREPVIVREAAGRFRVEGMQFHMPGYWEFHFDLVRDGRFERAQVAVELD